MSTTLRATAPLADVVAVEDVLVHSHTDFGWHCEMAGHAVFLGTLEIAPGTPMPTPGQRGTVMLTAATARALNLEKRHP